MSTACSDWAPFVFSDNMFFNSLSKLWSNELEKGSKSQHAQTLILLRNCIAKTYLDLIWSNLTVFMMKCDLLVYARIEAGQCLLSLSRECVPRTLKRTRAGHI